MIADPESRTRTMTGADMVLECLEREGVEVIFGYPGGANLPIYQHLPNHPNLRHILVRHEQGAAHMADGYARACGRPGVVFATSGPGALNTITGLATAFMDSVPMVVITGQVASTVVGRDAFQESDVIGCSQPGAKHNYLVTRVRDLPRVIKEAFQIASTGRPGPVLVDICKDVQQADWPDPVWPEAVARPGYPPGFTPELSQLERAVQALARAERPVSLAGHGVILSGGEEELIAVAEKSATPTGTPLRGMGPSPARLPLSRVRPVSG